MAPAGDIERAVPAGQWDQDKMINLIAIYIKINK